MYKNTFFILITLKSTLRLQFEAHVQSQENFTVILGHFLTRKACFIVFLVFAVFVFVFVVFVVSLLHDPQSFLCWVAAVLTISNVAWSLCIEVSDQLSVLLSANLDQQIKHQRGIETHKNTKIETSKRSVAVLLQERSTLGETVDLPPSWSAQKSMMPATT